MALSNYATPRNARRGSAAAVPAADRGGLLPSGRAKSRGSGEGYADPRVLGFCQNKAPTPCSRETSERAAKNFYAIFVRASLGSNAGGSCLCEFHIASLPRKLFRQATGSSLQLRLRVHPSLSLDR